MHQFVWEFWTFDSLTGTLFAAASFVIAFMLSGTLQDYSSSAYMPIEIVNALEAIEDANLLVAKSCPHYAPEPLRKELVAIDQAILAWLQEGAAIADVETSLENLNGHFSDMLKAGEVPVISRVQSEQTRIRLLIDHVRQIRDTDFLGPAYALLEFFFIGAVLTLLLVKTASFAQNLVMSSLLFTVFAYWLRLIRDLDNPFQYAGHSSLDVDLSSLVTLRDRLTQKLNSAENTA